MSGLVPSTLLCSLYPRAPCDQKALRRAISGAVSFALFALITRETTSLFGVGERLSLKYALDTILIGVLE